MQNAIVVLATIIVTLLSTFGLLINYAPSSKDINDINKQISILREEKISIINIEQAISPYISNEEKMLFDLRRQIVSEIESSAREFKKKIDTASIAKYVVDKERGKIRGQQGIKGDIGPRGPKGEAGLTQEDVESYVEIVISRRLAEIKTKFKEEIFDVRTPKTHQADKGGCVHISKLKSGDVVVMKFYDNFCTNDGQGVIRPVKNSGKKIVVYLPRIESEYYLKIDEITCFDSDKDEEFKKICMSLLSRRKVEENNYQLNIKIESFKR